MITKNITDVHSTQIKMYTLCCQCRHTVTTIVNKSGNFRPVGSWLPSGNFLVQFLVFLALNILPYTMQRTFRKKSFKFSWMLEVFIFSLEFIKMFNILVLEKVFLVHFITFVFVVYKISNCFDILIRITCRNSTLKFVFIGIGVYFVQFKNQCVLLGCHFFEFLMLIISLRWLNSQFN